MLVPSPLRMLVPAIAVIAATFPLSAAAAPAARTIELAGSGTVRAIPDTVSISTGVTAEGQTAQDALSKNTDAMTKVVEGLKEAGIDAKDIQTSNFNVSPIYEQKKEGQGAFITGYRVSNQVQITVRDTEKLGPVLDKAVSAGANQIDSISFSISEPEKLKDEARRTAMRNAIDNAKLYADTAGVELGPVVSIREGGDMTPRPFRADAVQMMAMEKAVPVEAGTLSIDANVHVTWELR